MVQLTHCYSLWLTRHFYTLWDLTGANEHSLHKTYLATFRNTHPAIYSTMPSTNVLWPIFLELYVWSHSAVWNVINGFISPVLATFHIEVVSWDKQLTFTEHFIDMHTYMAQRWSKSISELYGKRIVVPTSKPTYKWKEQFKMVSW